MSESAETNLPTIDPELDHQFVTTNWLIGKEDANFDPAEARKAFLECLRSQSDECRNLAKGSAKLHIPYGDQAEIPGNYQVKGEAAFDWFPPKQWSNETTLMIVFIHGGYWQALGLRESSHWANTVTEKGAIFVALSYELAPWQDIKHMPKNLCQGMQTVFQYTLKQMPSNLASKHNIQICFVGHSAGVQLALEMMVVANNSRLTNEPWMSEVKYLILLSGVYDLRPLIQTSLNKALKLQKTSDAWSISPLRYISKEYDYPLPTTLHWLIAWAQYDPPALQEQSQEALRLMQKMHMNSNKTDKYFEHLDSFYVENADHFTTIQNLFYGPSQCKLLKKIFEFVGLN